MTTENKLRKIKEIDPCNIDLFSNTPNEIKQLIISMLDYNSYKNLCRTNSVFSKFAKSTIGMQLMMKKYYNHTWRYSYQLNACGVDADDNELRWSLGTYTTLENAKQAWENWDETDRLLQLDVDDSGRLLIGAEIIEMERNGTPSLTHNNVYVLADKMTVSSDGLCTIVEELIWQLRPKNITKKTWAESASGFVFRVFP